MRGIRLALATALLTATAGCVAVVEDRHSSSGNPHGGPPGQMKKVVVTEGHVCFDSCEHFYIDGVWYIETGHHHGPSCGHYLVNGKWGKHKGEIKNEDKQGPKDKDEKEKKDKKDKDKD